jgi:aspartate racemase
MKTVGIIGGMGPGATLDLFQKIVTLTPAIKDQDHLHLVIDNFPQIPDRTSFLLGKGENPLPYLLKSAERLEAAGVDALCMPCNTAHYFVEEIRKNIKVPFLSIIDAAMKKIRTDFPEARKVGLMATRGTCDAGIYHAVVNSAGLEILPLREEFKAHIMEVINTVKAGHLTRQLELFRHCVQQMHNDGADILIAGCTEIPLLLPYIEPLLPFVDPTLALAENIVNFVKGEITVCSGLSELSAAASA